MGGSGRLSEAVVLFLKCVAAVFEERKVRRERVEREIEEIDKKIDKSKNCILVIFFGGG